MKDKVLMAVLSLFFFGGTLFSLRVGNHDLFMFCATLTTTFTGSLLTLVRGDHRRTDDLPGFPIERHADAETHSGPLNPR